MPAYPIDYPEVAMGFMNHDHAEFIQMRSEILELIDQSVADATIDTRLGELLSHTIRHFADEEQLMQEAHFPPYPIHKAEHDRVITEIQAKAASWQLNRDSAALSEWLDHAVGEWFVQHVNTMDRMTAAYAANQGIQK
jgi:hemerythrin